MLLKDVAKLGPVDRFVYWMRERHRIFKKKEAGEKKPWTDDEVLQNFFFTNPFRENDKVTVWFRENFREEWRNRPEVLFATIAFRWFNHIPTGEILLKHGLLTNWSNAKTKKVLSRLRDAGEKVFTGAFMIPSPIGETKVNSICDCITTVWRDRKKLLCDITSKEPFQNPTTLQEAHKLIHQYSYLGGFMSYEVVTDLRHTYLLENAPDIMKWANPGPGCVRGLYRLEGMSMKEMGVTSNASMPKKPKDLLDRMQNLRVVVARKLPKKSGYPAIEMREIEHSLCEFDKYERARLGDGRMKRNYPGAV